jgi:ABC-type nitrate/sulfonate/bicarbonate transport system ATPase subunit
MVIIKKKLAIENIEKSDENQVNSNSKKKKKPKSSHLLREVNTKHKSSIFALKIVVVWIFLLYLLYITIPGLLDSTHKYEDLDGDGVLSNDGDKLSRNIDNSGIDLQASIDDQGSKISLKWEELSVRRKTGANTHIETIRPMSGSLHPGQLTAIMGGSGSGKSTFLRALMGRLDSSEFRSGTIYINDMPADVNSIGGAIGFVPQDDIMHDDLSVEENLLFSAEWRLNNTMYTKPVRRGIVNDVLNRLGIAQWRNIRVGKGSDSTKSHISGGQKKRVNIGMELVADPSVLFLDE